MASVACLMRKPFSRCLLAAAGLTSWLLVALAVATPAHAQIGSARYSSIVVDASTGEVLEEVNADQPRHPASLTKMMTLYMVFEALRDLSPNTRSIEPLYRSPICVNTKTDEFFVGYYVH